MVLLPLDSFAEILQGDCGALGNNVTYKLDTETGVLEFFGSGKMIDYEDDGWGGVWGCPWYEYRQTIKEIKIATGITRIGNYCLYGIGSSNQVSYLVIPKKVTELGEYALASSRFETLVVGTGITSVGDYAFSGTRANYCYYLNNDLLPSFMGGHYSNLYVPLSFYEKEFNGSYPFSSGRFFTNLSYYDQSSTYAWESGWILTTGNELHVFGLGPIAPMDPWTNYKDRVEKVRINKGVTNVKSGAFLNHTNLHEVSIPNTVSTICDNAFNGCSSMESISVPSSVVTIEQNAFSNCNKLKTVWLYNGLKTIGNAAFCPCTSLTSISIPNSVEQIEGSAFRLCSNLQNVTFGKNVKTLGNDVLSKCSSLQSVTFNSIPKFGTGLLDGSSISSINLNLADDSYIYTGSNSNMPTCANATYTRSIAASSNWGTLVLPYAIASDENVQLYELTDVSNEAMTFSQVESIDANTPCVFKKKDAVATNVTFAATNVNAEAPNAIPIAYYPNNWSMKGAYGEVSGQTGMFYIAQDGIWYAEKPITIKPFRAWIWNSDPSLRHAKAFSIFEQENDTEDAIQVLEEMNNGSAEYYDLNGRRMDGLQKGINIIKYGQDKTKKVIIK